MLASTCFCALLNHVKAHLMASQNTGYYRVYYPQGKSWPCNADFTVSYGNSHPATTAVTTTPLTSVIIEKSCLSVSLLVPFQRFKVIRSKITFRPMQRSEGIRETSENICD